jgi:hypothetical protein
VLAEKTALPAPSTLPKGGPTPFQTDTMRLANNLKLIGEPVDPSQHPPQPQPTGEGSAPQPTAPAGSVASGDAVEDAPAPAKKVEPASSRKSGSIRRPSALSLLRRASLRSSASKPLIGSDSKPRASATEPEPKAEILPEDPAPHAPPLPDADILMV